MFALCVALLYEHPGRSDDCPQFSIGLIPGERLLIVRDLAAFQTVYGNAHDARIAGAFQNGTALNDGGETLTLTDSTVSEIIKPGQITRSG